MDYKSHSGSLGDGLTGDITIFPNTFYIFQILPHESFYNRKKRRLTNASVSLSIKGG